MNLQSLTHYLPIVTTLLSIAFFVILYHAINVRKSGPHLVWWAAGVAFYGAGTLVESYIGLIGNTVFATKLWYILGALLGGFPLAQGVAYLHFSKKTANATGWAFSGLILALSIAVLLSPVNAQYVEVARPTGKILGWTMIRYFTPFVNLYAFVLLVGGAVASAVRYSRKHEQKHRFVGNIYIAVGGLLPGIGGSIAVTGLVEALYVCELIGIYLVWAGFSVNSQAESKQITLA